MLQRLRIVSKLLIGFGALLTIIAALAISSGVGGWKSNGALEALAAIKNDEVVDLRIAKRFEEARVQMWMALATGDATHWGNADIAMQIAQNTLEQLHSATEPPERLAKIQHWSELIAKYNDLEAKLQTLKGRNEAMGTVNGKQFASVATLLGADIANAGEQLAREYESSANAVQSQASRLSLWLAKFAVGVGAVGLVLGVGLTYLITRSVQQPISNLTTAMSALAGGELEVGIPGVNEKNEIGSIARSVDVFKTNAIEKRRVEAEAAAHRAEAERQRVAVADELRTAAEAQAEAMRRIGEGLKTLAAGNLTVRLGPGFGQQHAQIVQDFNEAIEKLAGTMRAVVSGASAIDAGTQEIKKSSDEISRRSEQQAARLEETAAGLGEVTATVRKSADNARHAREIVATADSDAKKGAAVVRDAVASMEAISKSSQQVAQIIGVIDEIAFQTSLLALNAGVEAARAGDAGKGFAVVASEVRGLAQRSADAAKEIKQLISNSTAQVQAGVKLVDDTGATLERILAEVTEINGLVANIASATQEQAASLEHVNSAINQMDRTTQENAGMVAETATASQALSEQTTQLAELIEQFQVGELKATPRERAWAA